MTPKARISSESHGIPREIIDAVLNHLDDDQASLRACTLVSSSWQTFARCHLLHSVVCNPGASPLSPRHLSTFLSSTPEIVPYVHSLKIIGGKPLVEDEVAVEDIVDLVSALPNLNSLSFERVALFSRARAHDTSIERAPLTGPECFTIGLCAIRFIGSTRSFQVLRDCLGPRSIRAVLRFASRDDHSSLPAFLNIFGPNIVHLSCNLLGSVGDIRMLAGGPEIEDLVYDPCFDPHVDVPPCTSVNELVLYLTGSEFADADMQLMLFWGQLLAIGGLMKFLAPKAPIRHVAVRFQRFGPHTKTTERMIGDLLDPRNWFQCIGWLEQLLLPFEGLETMTCVLCDDGLVEQYGDYLPADLTSTASSPIERDISSEDEYAFCENFVRTIFPQFLTNGVLQIRRA